MSYTEFHIVQLYFVPNTLENQLVCGQLDPKDCSQPKANKSDKAQTKKSKNGPNLILLTLKPKYGYDVQTKKTHVDDTSDTYPQTKS